MNLDMKLGKLVQVEKVISSSGNAERWKIFFLLTTDTSKVDLLAQIGSVLSPDGKWGKASASPGQQQNQWAFQDEDGKSWLASAGIEKVTGNDRQQVLAIGLERPKDRQASNKHSTSRRK